MAIAAGLSVLSLASLAQEEDADADGEDDGFRTTCPRHEDYIWQVDNGSSGEKRGEAGFSVYHVCDVGREDRADEIIAEHVAPILN